MELVLASFLGVVKQTLKAGGEIRLLGWQIRCARRGDKWRGATQVLEKQAKIGMKTACL